MIFHYVGGALMCEIKIKGLTTTVNGWTVNSWRRDSDYRVGRDDFDDYRLDSENWYGGYKYFVCESLSRSAAQKIVDALGGYLVPDIIPPSHQLVDGGPFHVHYFSLRAPMRVGQHRDIRDALFMAEKAKKQDHYRDGSRYRVYDNSGFMVAEFK